MTERFDLEKWLAGVEPPIDGSSRFVIHKAVEAAENFQREPMACGHPRACWAEKPLRECSVTESLAALANELGAKQPLASYCTVCAELSRARSEARAEAEAQGGPTEVFIPEWGPPEPSKDELLARLAKGETKTVLEAIDERDKAEEAFSQAYYLITGRSPEWSNNFGYDRALVDIDDAQKCLRAEVNTIESRVSERTAAKDAEIDALADCVKDYAERTQRLREALEFYTQIKSVSEARRLFVQDGGATARRALESE